MSDARAPRIRIHGDGAVTFVDPDPSILPLIRELDPLFEIQQEPLRGFTAPRLNTTASRLTEVAKSELLNRTTEELWLVHAGGCSRRRERAVERASLLDVKIELARRILRDCDLCGAQCHVDRIRGEMGRCGLANDAFVYEAYVHIAEEPSINPSLNISLRGCGMRCRFCQQFDALRPRGAAADLLRPAIWAQLDLTLARSLTFVGGNPTESLPSILEFLGSAPEGFTLPVVWNSAGYDSVAALRLLTGVCDAFVPDWKYGNDECAVAMSSAPNYIGMAAAAIEEMCRQDVPVFVRMLLLPGHIECCHLPSLELLLPWRSKLHLNVMSQYLPDFLIRPSDGAMARRVTGEEAARVRDAAVKLGFDVMGTPRRPVTVETPRGAR